MQGKRVLVTGPSGQIAGAVARLLAADNEVWGLARFGDAVVRSDLEAAGVRTCSVDLAQRSPDFSALPEHFDHVLHLAAYLGPGNCFTHALQVNAMGTGRLLSRFRGAGSVLVMSSGSVYAPHPDPEHLYVETDPLGDGARALVPTYSISKVAQETVAGYCAEEFGIPTIIGRMNVAYGRNGGIPYEHMKLILAGQSVTLREDPLRYSPIHESDIVGHLDALLAAADVTAPIVNFGGDEVVTAQQWCRLIGQLGGIEPMIRIESLPGMQPGMSVDPTERQRLTGPDRMGWQDGIRDMYDWYVSGSRR